MFYKIAINKKKYCGIVKNWWINESVFIVCDAQMLACEFDKSAVLRIMIEAIISSHIRPATIERKRIARDSSE